MSNSLETTYGNKVRVRACGICVKNESLLLVKHIGLGKKGMLWIPPGGGIEPGETTENTIKREFLEETGLNVEVKDFLFVNEFIRPPLHAIELFFSVVEASGYLNKGHDPEVNSANQIINEVKFVTFQEIQLMDNETLHNSLHDVQNQESLLNKNGYFQFRQ